MSEITRRGFGRMAGLTVLAAGISAGTGSVSAAAGAGSAHAAAGTGSVSAGAAAGEPFALRHLSSFGQRRYFTRLEELDRFILQQMEQAPVAPASADQT